MKVIWVLMLGWVLGIGSHMLYEVDFSCKKNSYNFESAVDRRNFILILDRNGYLYSYEIDHLKRHWITPWMVGCDGIEKVEAEFYRVRAAK